MNAYSLLYLLYVLPLKKKTLSVLWIKRLFANKTLSEVYIFQVDYRRNRNN